MQHHKAPTTLLKHLMLVALLGGIFSWVFVDISLRDFINAHPIELVRSITWILGRPGQTTFWIVGCIAVWVLARRHSRYCPSVFREPHTLNRFFLQLSIALLLSGLIVTLVKYGVGRPRPSEFFRSGAIAFQPFNSSPRYASFPSGHAQTVWAGVATCILFFPQSRVWLIIAGIFGCVGRVIMLRHYPSDICAGAIIGTWAALAAHQVVISPRVIGWITPRLRVFVAWAQRVRRSQRMSHQAPQ